MNFYFEIALNIIFEKKKTNMPVFSSIALIKKLRFLFLTL